MKKIKEAFDHEAFKGSSLDSIEDSTCGLGRGTLSSVAQELQDKLSKIEKTKYLEKIAAYQKLKEANRLKDISDE